jgi:hypothetical protein
MANAFEKSDRSFLAKLAPLYRADVPIHENPEYVAKVNELRDDMDAELKGMGNLYSSRIDRGWSPPNLKDVEAEESAAETEAKA